MIPDRGYRKSMLPPGAKRAFQGKIFDVWQWEQELYDGTTRTFERIARPDTIVVFPVIADGLPGQGTIILVEDSQPDRESILTAPAGRVEEGETPKGCAQRELREEAGYEAETLELPVCVPAVPENRLRKQFLN